MNVYEEALTLKKSNRIFAIAMITNAKGSTPRSTAKMLVRDDGSTMGTIGGGPVEMYVIEQAKEAMAEQKNRSCQYTLIMKKNDGMHCGGEMSFFIDVEVPVTSLVLIGAGHVNQAVAKVAFVSGFQIAVIDNRRELLLPDLFPPSVELIYGNSLEEASDKCIINENSYIIVATGNEDSQGLKSVLHKKFKFIAMVGSKRKALMVKKGLREEGWSDKDLNKVICPAGLDIGAESPGEIAISLLSQILMHRTNSSAKEYYKSNTLKNLIVIRGAGDIASGTIYKLIKAGYPVLALETEMPTLIRRTVSFGEAVHLKEVEIEGVKGELIETIEELEEVILKGHVAIMVDPEGFTLKDLNPPVLIDAILAKKNLGTNTSMAPLTIALGPGFVAPNDVNYIVETCRGFDLGRIISEGTAKKNTGIPGDIEGYSQERIVRSPASGIVTHKKDIGSLVKKGELIGMIDEKKIESPLDGLIRGFIREGSPVTEGLKIGDIDPRGKEVNYMNISDKALAIGGSVLEILLSNEVFPQ